MIHGTLGGRGEELASEQKIEVAKGGAKRVYGDKLSNSGDILKLKVPSSSRKISG